MGLSLPVKTGAISEANRPSHRKLKIVTGDSLVESGRIPRIDLMKIDVESYDKPVLAGLRASHLGGVGYNASKFAMNALGTSASGDELENNIRITTICPGEVDTPILDDRQQPPSAEHRTTILQASDVAEMAVAVAKLPPRAHVPELTIKPTSQLFV